MFRELLRGKGLLRTMQNLACVPHTLSGRVLDVGAKDGRSSYLRFFRVESDLSLTMTDIEPRAPEVLRADLERGLPFANGAFERVLLFNVLYLVADPERALKECRRVLSPSGGKLIGTVPFLYKLIPEPIEYFRFSADAVRLLCQRAGFSRIEVTPLSKGPLSAAAALACSILPFPRVCAPVILAAVASDLVLAKIFPMRAARWQESYPLGYLFVAEV